jgi:hypothetical protein
MTEEFNPFAKEVLLETLRKHELRVEFTKADGSNRVMFCTLKENVIPEAFRPKSEKLSNSDEVLRVFDTEFQGWRSFRIDSVSSFEVL